MWFWLFQNYVKWDLMSNNMKMNGDMRSGGGGGGGNYLYMT